MSAHTPEPWEMAFQECHTGGVATCHGDGGWFEVWSRHWGEGVDAQANAARIVACVNPMKGIEDPAHHMKELAKFAELHTEVQALVKAAQLKHNTRASNKLEEPSKWIAVPAKDFNALQEALKPFTQEQKNG